MSRAAQLYPRVTFISSATRYTWNLSEVKATIHSLESPSTEIPSIVAIPALDYYYCPLNKIHKFS